VRVDGAVALVSGGASGLGLASARKLAAAGAALVVLDLPTSQGARVAEELGSSARFVPGDVTVAEDVQAAVDAARELGELRALVHTAGMGLSVRVVDRAGEPGSLETFQRVVDVNLVGTFNVLRTAAAAMAKNEPVDGERGACVLTASIAAWEGQIGQIPYSAAKGGIVGMTLVAARDLAGHGVRVCTIAPGLFDTPLLGQLRDDIREQLAGGIPQPRRLGNPEEYADLALAILGNPYLNGETIRLDGALRMAPR
jgi:NAD(P)-dependent dehydrogenase (short-subunit alcohol dehydrogenase family)